MNLHHIAIWVNDPEREKDFFLRYFSCTASEKYINTQKKFSSYFILFNDGGRIEIMKRDDISEKSNDELMGYAHIAIDAGSRESVNDLTARFINDGVELISGPRITGDGYYESVILDPEKNRIEILSE